MRQLFAALAFLVLGMPCAWADQLPAIRQEKEFDQEAQVWVRAAEMVKTSGQPLSIYNDGSDEAKTALHGVMGPFMRTQRLEYVWLSPDGTFGFKFDKKYQVDLPLKAGGYVRVNIDDQECTGSLTTGETRDKKIPVKLIVFNAPYALQIDKLDENRKSTVPKVGKLLGLLPHIVAIAVVEVDGVPYAAPQLNGMGASENYQIAFDMLHVDDCLLPEKMLSNNSGSGGGTAKQVKEGGSSEPTPAPAAATPSPTEASNK